MKKKKKEKKKKEPAKRRGGEETMQPEIVAQFCQVGRLCGCMERTNKKLAI
jgi:hypothetical protein